MVAVPEGLAQAGQLIGGQHLLFIQRHCEIGAGPHGPSQPGTLRPMPGASGLSGARQDLVANLILELEAIHELGEHLLLGGHDGQEEAQNESES